MDSIQQCLYDFPSTPLHLIIGINFAFNYLIKNGLVKKKNKKNGLVIEQKIRHFINDTVFTD